jgi:hypothetical protein
VKKAIGWLLFLIGVAGIIGNIVYLVAWGISSWGLVGNTFFCLLFIAGGWYLSHPKKAVSGGQIGRPR